VTGPSRQLSPATRRACASARYALGERIASGGMGIIYRARDALRERDVAFKRPTVQRGQKRARVLAQFEHEFRTLLQLAHPGIVEAYDYGIDDVGPYYTMELLDGRDLRAGVPLPIGQACKLVCEVASALALVHARRLVHRDLSPANVLLTSNGRAKLIDFGALISFGRPTNIVGTPSYIAPECLHPNEIDQRADLYSLGALAYWILTGVRAIRADSLRDLSLDPWSQGIPAPSCFVPALPKVVDELLLALLHRDPLARPESAAHVIDRLSGFAAPAFEEDVQRVGTSYVAYPPLVGRTKQLRQLHQLMHQSAKRRGAAVWIEGAPGIGRSTLLDRIALDAQVTGATVLRARGGLDATPLSTARGLVASALRSHPDLRDFCEQLRPGLAAFCLQEAEAPAGDASQRVRVTTTAAEGYAQVLSDMQEVLLALGRQQSVVITVDDVQRADAESVGLLASLAHATANSAVLLLVSVEREGAEGAPEGLEQLAKRARRVVLTELEEADISALVTGVFGAVPNATRVARWLYARCDGIPQRALELLHLLLERGLVWYRNGLFTLPHDLGSELGDELERVPQARLQALGPEAQRLAQLLGIEPAGVPLGVLAAAMNVAAAAFFAAAEELTGRGIAIRLDGSLTLASRRMRAAVECGLDPKLRSELHLCLARAILADGSSADHRIGAGTHLLHAGKRVEGAALLSAAAEDITHRAEGIVKAVPALEQALAVYRAQGRTDLECIRLLVPLTVAGFYGDPRLSGRYLEPTYRALLDVSGVALAARLRRFLGKKLALPAALACSYVRFLFLPPELRTRQFQQVLVALFGVASAGAAAFAAAYDQDGSAGIGARLAPFEALGSGSGAHAVRELCQGLAELTRSMHAQCAQRMRRLTQRLAGPRPLFGLDAETRMQMKLGALYLLGMLEVYAGDSVVLALASELEESGRTFSQPRATLLRMFHHGFRGEQTAADAQREKAEAQALLGGSLWSARSAVALRQLLMCQWTRDSVGLLRVVSDLERLSAIAPALDAHRELGLAFLELLRGNPQRALPVYERRLRGGAARRVVNWQAETAHWAQALNALGRHADAREVCLRVTRETGAADRRMRFVYQLAEQELAIADGGLGNLTSAAARLDGLLEEVAPLRNPLLSGSLHRDRCRVARLAHDAANFELHLLKMTEHFRLTRNPSLIQQCERLSAEGASAGLSLPTERKRRGLAAHADRVVERAAHTTASFERSTTGSVG
jgi:hypothetical protein